MSKGLVVVQETNISVAWAKAFINLMEAGVNEIIPLVVDITNLADDDATIENPEIRQSLDFTLSQNDKQSCQTVANTIFPISLWNRNLSKDESFKQLIERYKKILPSLRSQDQRNRNGLYFERLVAFNAQNSSTSRINQIEHIIKIWHSGNHRRSALQLSIFDPAKDHSNQRQRGFPCLQQIALSFNENSHLNMTALYANQYFFEKAYGNYIGLYNLGQFLGHQLDLKFNQLTCIASVAQLGKINKKSLRQLELDVKRVIETHGSSERSLAALKNYGTLTSKLDLPQAIPTHE